MVVAGFDSQHHNCISKEKIITEYKIVKYNLFYSYINLFYGSVSLKIMKKVHNCLVEKGGIIISCFSAVTALVVLFLFIFDVINSINIGEASLTLGECSLLISSFSFIIALFSADADILNNIRERKNKLLESINYSLIVYKLLLEKYTKGYENNNDITGSNIIEIIASIEINIQNISYLYELNKRRFGNKFGTELESLKDNQAKLKTYFNELNNYYPKQSKIYNDIIDLLNEMINNCKKLRQKDIA